MHKIAKCNKYDTFINFIKYKYKFMLYKALSLTFDCYLHVFFFLTFVCFVFHMSGVGA